MPPLLRPPPATAGPLGKVVNGPVLSTAQWFMGMTTVHPSKHRLLNAIGLTVGLFMGRKTMDLLVGETPGGEKILKEEVPEPLRPLHGILAYNHFSDDPKDRWMKVIDMWIPAVLGAAGAMAGSHWFAMESPYVQGINQSLLKKELPKLTLDQAEQASIMLQSHPWRILSGATSVFGSASGMQLIPGPANYGSALAASFIGAAERNKLHTPYLPIVQRFFSGNKHPFPQGPASMLPRLHGQMLHNTAANPKQERQMAYAILEPWFGNKATQEHVSKFLGEVHAARDKFFKAGGVPENLKKECGEALDKVLKGVGLEKTFQKIGLDPSQARIGNNGFMEYLGRLMGADKHLNELSHHYRLAYFARNNIKNGHLPPVKENAPGAALGMAFVGGVLAMVGVGAFGARDWHQADNDELFHRNTADAANTNTPSESTEKTEASKAFAVNQKADSKTEAPTQEDEAASAPEIVKHHAAKIGERKNRAKDSWADFVNGNIDGKPLSMMEWASDALNSPETLGTHRVACALGLSTGGYIGMKIMEILTGFTLTNKPVELKEIPTFLRQFHKKLAYNPHSDHPRDRWGYVLHFLVPAALGSMGVIGASNHFFRERRQKLEKAEYLDEFDEKTTIAQAGPWTAITAFAAPIVTPSGFPFVPFPFPNYGTALGTRFTLSSGRKMIFPGLGEFWTGTASRYPLGPSKLRDHMIRYAVNNPDRHPEQLEEMAIGILKPWFEHVTAEQVDAFIQRIEADRDKFLGEGGIPENMKRDAERELTKHFKGAGLEKTLREIGLDPEKAHLGNNGFSGKVAQWLGPADDIQEIRQEFCDLYQHRLEREKAAQDKAAVTPATPKPDPLAEETKHQTRVTQKDAGKAEYSLPG